MTNDVLPNSMRVLSVAASLALLIPAAASASPGAGAISVAKPIAKSSSVVPVAWRHDRFFHDRFGQFRRTGVGFVGVGVEGG